MTDRLTSDAFEQRLAAEFERLVAGATDPTPIAEIQSGITQVTARGRIKHANRH